MKPRLAFAFAFAGIVAASCGGDFANGGVGVDGGGDNNDGSTVGCVLSLVQPSNSGVGQAVEVAAVIEGSSFGIQEFSWSVDLGGVNQSFTPLSDPADRIAFTPQEAGPYRVVVGATVGGEDCLPAMTTIGVVATGARRASYRMRVVPANGAPMQDVPIDIYGGADAVLPVAVLSAGQTVSGTLVDSSGAGVAAYLRARVRGSDTIKDFETFSSNSGAFSLRLPDEQFDVLVVPQGGLNPSMLFLDRSASDISGTLALAPSTAIAGRVLDAGGGAVQGARVTLLVDGARTTEAVSGVDGGFVVQAAGTTLTGLSVAPAPGSGMPSLRSETLSGQTVGEASEVLIRYADASMSADVDITTAAGAAAVGATVEWRAELSNAGTVEVDAVESVAGTLRVQAIADGAGRAQATLVARDSNMVVFASDGAEARIVRDVPWATAPISALNLEALLPIPVSASHDGSPLEGAVVQALPLGILAPQSGIIGAITGVDGSTTVGLVSGGTYQVQISHPLAGEEVDRIETIAPATQIGPVVLPGTIVAAGLVTIDAEPAPGAQVRLFCDDCPLADATRVHASAVADGSGRFRFRVSDPGIDTP